MQAKVFGFKFICRKFRTQISILMGGFLSFTPILISSARADTQYSPYYAEPSYGQAYVTSGAPNTYSAVAVPSASPLAISAAKLPAQTAVVPQEAPAPYKKQEDAGAETGRINIMEENDYFASHDDRHYTQGARVSYLSSPVTHGGFWDAPYSFFGDILPIFEGGDYHRKYEWTIVGQSIFTPTNTLAAIPSAKDWPYGAWLYTGASLLQEDKHETHHTLENLEFDVGIVGPPALGEITQNDFHEFINETPSQGWTNQLKTEPGFMATYERKWRFQQSIVGNFAVDAIPELGATVGNVMTYGEGGGIVRIGQNLAADYGSDRIRPSLSGTGWFDGDQLDGNLGWYLFAGTQGRAVGYNIFLDGNTYQPSPSVEKKNLVADFMVGASLFWASDIRIDFTITQRTKQFYSEEGHPDRFGGLNLAFQFF